MQCLLLQSHLGAIMYTRTRYNRARVHITYDFKVFATCTQVCQLPLYISSKKQEEGHYCPSSTKSQILATPSYNGVKIGRFEPILGADNFFRTLDLEV